MFNNIFNSAVIAEYIQQNVFICGLCLAGAFMGMCKCIGISVKFIVVQVKKLWNKIKNSKSEDNEEA